MHHTSALMRKLPINLGQDGSSSCRELLGIEILTEEGRAKGRELNLFNTVCKDCIRKVAEYLEKEIAQG